MASHGLRNSPRLASFLRFVVEMALTGRGDRIKGYTIGVEALGREADFDPQLDPIVRVEAGRLRRALAAYYAEAGAADAVTIEIPRGSYVPQFHYRAPAASSPPPEIAGGVAPSPRRAWRPLLATATLTFVTGILAALVVISDRLPATAVPGTPPPAELGLAGSVHLPLLSVQRFELIGDDASARTMLGRLRTRLRDVLARFDDIEVVWEAPDRVETTAAGSFAGSRAGARVEYRIAATADAQPDGSLALSVRLLDAGDRSILWSQRFGHVRGDDLARIEAILRELATTLAQPYGVVFAEERIRHALARNFEPRFRCLIDAYQYWRGHRLAQHVRVRACMEAATAADPLFALGFSALARIYLREHLYGIDPQPHAAPALARALAAARHAVELKPESARAHQVLAAVLMVQGEVSSALAAAREAVALNPYDMYLLADYGGLLLLAGRFDEGAALLREAAIAKTLRPSFYDFAQFLVAYLDGDLVKAALHIEPMQPERYPFAALAAVLLAQARNDQPAVREAAERLVGFGARWATDPRAELARFVKSQALLDRLAADLVKAGLPRAPSP